MGQPRIGYAGRAGRLRFGHAALRLEVLEARRLLHAGHEHTDPDPGVVLEGDFSDSGMVAEPQAVHALSSIPALASLPGVGATLYLDFDGHFEPSWGTYGAVTTPVFDRDNDLTTFSDDELSRMQQVWAQVSEDFAPFKINVTTIEPASFANGVALRVAIGGNSTWTGKSIGGIAYVNDFTSPVANTVFVFSKNLSNGSAKSMAEASSHEAGHAFGLQHQSQYDINGEKIAEYYPGPGNGTAPIMGNSYSATRGLWWYGTSSDSATALQDDMSIISKAANGFGYRADDHGNTVATATPLSSVGNSFVNAGIITTTTDVDYFSFATQAGQVSFSVTVPAGINNLDARLELRDLNNVLIVAAAPSNSFNATIVTTLQAGSYRVVVASQGNYGDVGQYTLNGSFRSPSIEGRVFLDANRNGLLDDDELGVATWKVFDDLNNNGQFDLTPQSVFQSTDTPLSVPDLGSQASYLQLTGLIGEIADINVRFTVQHARTSDLAVTLTSPDGFSVLLVVGAGGEGDNFLDTGFDDDASVAIGAAQAPYTGTFRPVALLSSFNGRDPNGQWRLRISDLVTGEAGQLDNWSLEITTSAPEVTAQTDAQGQYLFAFANAGEHHIRPLLDPGFMSTLPAAGVYDVNAGVGGPALDQDFGVATSIVLMRALFYNQSAFDGHTAGVSPSDDGAIAPDKSAYLPGTGTATFANISSYTRGINGLMIDLPTGHGPLTLDDFAIRIGNDNTASGWQDAPEPVTIETRLGAGVGGSDRVELIWANGAIQNTWLEVIVRGNDSLGGNNTNTGLAASDRFYFGSRVGDTGSGTPVSAITNLSDEIAVRNNTGAGAAITNIYDFDRNGSVQLADGVAARNNTGSTLKLNLTNPPAAPEALPLVATQLLDARQQARSQTGESSLAGPAAGLSWRPDQRGTEALAQLARHRYFADLSRVEDALERLGDLSSGAREGEKSAPGEGLLAALLAARLS